ncbi:unnamed protein product [Penicillium olsonii]|uniref:Uncharacterized protein n=1 Tax=Penicillium olsonii TaxID=99116 RepID=A0A9W4HDH6_PENOL|nr:unnamed protein product [Penicillium olsonii]CAG8150112.1 unnamed protein product [Penicillium olsonii]CAG8204747.1 unnamed protein product [Penicillium olsonii]
MYGMECWPEITGCSATPFPVAAPRHSGRICHSQGKSTVELFHAGGSISELTSSVPLAPMEDDERTTDFEVQISPRARSGSTSSHKRSLSGSLFSRLSFLRMSQANASNRDMPHDDADLRSMPHNPGEGSTSRAMSAAIAQRRTRRRRGSLRKTALLGTRLESRERRASKAAEALRPDFTLDDPQTSSPLKTQLSPDAPTQPPQPLRQSFDDDQPTWFRAKTQKPVRPSITRRRQGVAQHTLHAEETATDEEDLVTLPRLNMNPQGQGSSPPNTAANFHLSPPPPDNFYLSPETTYRPVHRPKSSPLATHSVEMKSSPEVDWDYSETEWWGWIILMVTWLVFVVGIGSCFEVWSWAWDVGETPYAPPELEDDPTLPIVGYYPALIILTAVMSWVWVVVAWVGMKYFKHANISGEDI